MRKNINIYFSLFFFVAIMIFIVHSCQYDPSLWDTRKAREMMRSDMTLVIREIPEITYFDDDQKTKIGSSILSIEIAPDSWSCEYFLKNESLLIKLGWHPSVKSSEGTFFCKNGASALIMESEKRGKIYGYIYMKYPADLRAKCHSMSVN